VARPEQRRHQRHDGHVYARRLGLQRFNTVAADQNTQNSLTEIWIANDGLHYAQNGVESPVTPSLPALSQALRYLYLGNSLDGTHGIDTAFGELVLAKETPTAAQRTAYQAYVKTKWSVPIGGCSGLDRCSYHDSCCPAGCTHDTDVDCPSGPVGGDCSTVTGCTGGDGCCPAGCERSGDGDCPPLPTCDPNTPCANGTGPCHSDSDCEAGLACGFGIGNRFGYSGTDGVCWNPTICATSHPDPANCGTGKLCGNCCSPSCTAPGQPDGCGGTCAACDANADSDHDGISDCIEQQDANTWTDPLVFNGVDGRLGAACSTTPSCSDIDSLDKITNCFRSREAHPLASGWSFSTSDTDACQSGFGFNPAFTQCGTNFSVFYGGAITLAQTGRHCFQLTGSTDAQCAALFFDRAFAGTTGSNVACTTRAAGVYPISWFYETENTSHNELHVNYCYSATGDCTPTQALPEAMLRRGVDGIPAPVCTPNCSGKACGSDGCGGFCDKPCASGQDACASNSDCDIGFVCAVDNGARFGMPSGTRTCWPSECDGLGQASFGCGTTTDLCGLCPACQPRCGDSECGDDGCGGQCDSCASGLSCDPQLSLCVAVAGASQFDLPPGMNVTTASVGTLPGKVDVGHGGNATYTIPLELPPGRGDIQPELSLHYDSSSGNGFLGVGWALDGLSAVTRCNKTIAQDGVASAPAFTSDDAFCLDGRRIVEVGARTTDAAGNEIRTYHTEEDRFSKIEASFRSQPLEPGGPSPLGPINFIVHAKNGRIYEYKHSLSGPSPHDANGNLLTNDSVAWALNTIQTWALSSVKDRTGGNVMRVAYEDRTRDTANGWAREYYPRTIEYGNLQSPIGLRFFYTFDPEYGETRTDTIEEWRNGVLLHTDALLRRISVRLNDHYIRHYELSYAPSGNGENHSRLATATDCAGGDTPATSACKPATLFDYLPTLALTNTAQPFGDLASLNPSISPQHAYSKNTAPIVLDLNGDGADDMLVAVGDISQGEFEYRSEAWTWYAVVSAVQADGSFVYTVTNTNQLIASLQSSGLFLIASTHITAVGSGDGAVFDWDNDGRQDVIEYNWAEANQPRQYTVLTYDGQQVRRIRTDIPQPADHDFNGSPGQTYILDVDGDHYKDLLVCDPTPTGPNWRLYRNRGGDQGSALSTGNAAGFLEAQREDLDLPLVCRQAVIAIDTNGDGKDELLLPDGLFGTSPGILVTFPDGHLPVLMTTNAWGGDPSGTLALGLGAPKSKTLVLDMNGDGLADIVRYDMIGHDETDYVPTFRIQISRGDGSFAIGSETLDLSQQEASARRIDPAGAMIGTFAWDANLDGKDDLIVAWNAEPHAWLSDGNRFAGLGPRLNAAGPVIDANGDGVTGLLSGIDHYVERTPQSHEVLYQVRNGLGARTWLQYGPFADPALYTSRLLDGTTANCERPFECRFPKGFAVRNQYEFDDPLTQPDAFAPTRLTRFHYEDGRYDAFGRGWLGFSQRSEEERSADGSELKHSTTEYFDNQTRDDDVRDYLGAFRPNRVVHVDYNGFIDFGVDTTLEYQSTRPTPQSYALYEKTRTATRFEYSELTGDYVALPSDIHVVSQHDDTFGNPLQEITSANGTDTLTVTRNYKHLEPGGSSFVDDWLIGLPTRQTEEYTVQVSGNSVTKTRTSTWDWYENGLSKQAITDPDLENQRLVTDYGRDGVGNVTTITQTGISHGATQVRRTSFGYDELDEYPTEVTNAANQTSLVQYDRANGSLQAVQDANGIVTQWRTDGFSRPEVTLEPTGRITQNIYSRIDDTLPFAVEVTSNDGSRSRQEFDVRARLKKKHTWGVDGKELVEARGYDTEGQLQSVSRPRLASLPPDPNTIIATDNHGVAREITRDGQTSTACYSARAYCVTTPRGFTSCALIDALGRITQTVDPVAEDCETALFAAPGRTGTRYTYDPFGTLASIMDQAGHMTQMTADVRGRPIALDDRDTGYQSRGYNAFGEIDSFIDAVNQITLIDHDRLGRITQRTDVNARGPGQDAITRWTWDGGESRDLADGELYGALTETQSPDGVHRRIRYNPLTGLPETTIEDIGAESFTTTRVYDGYGRLFQLIYPQAPGLPSLVAQNNYDTSGHLKSVSNPNRQDDYPFWTLYATDDYGKVSAEYTGDLVVTSYGYDSFGRTVQIYTSKAGTQYQNTAYTRDEDGNVATRTDWMHDRAETFSYDSFDRLLSDGTTHLTYTYDSIGNLKADPSTTFDPVHPHALASEASYQYQYDADGRRIRRSYSGSAENPAFIENLAYTPFGMPSSIWMENTPDVRTNIVNYAYDADRHRALKDTDQQTTIYVDGLYERRTQKGSGAAVEHVYYVSNGSSVVAKVSMAVGASPQVSYVHSDYLGSTRLVTSDPTGVVQEFEYEAFGNPRKADWSAGAPPPNTTGVNVSFTGQEDDSEHGLINMRGRIYDPRARQFLTPDPIVQFPFTTSGLNRYSYVLDNPLRFVDPTGYQTAGGADDEAADAGDQAPFGAKATIHIGRPIGSDGRDSLTDVTTESHTDNPLQAPGNAGPIGSGDAARVSQANTIGLPDIRLPPLEIPTLELPIALAPALAAVTVLAWPNTAGETDRDLERSFLIYRTMTPALMMPKLGASARTLGVRPGIDITVDSGNVSPQPNGMSVSPGDPLKMKPFRRPPSFGGTGPASDLVWQMDVRLLPPGLLYVPDPTKPTEHGFISPGVTMPFQAYQNLLWSTQPLWSIAPVPP
jgi:RHS repeat-associated protein